jgi:hypothetical protein
VLAAGLILSAAAAARRAGFDDRRSIAVAVALGHPVSAWLPDRCRCCSCSPVSRWAIAAMAMAIVLLATTHLQEWLAAILRLRRRTVFVVISLCTGVGLYSEDGRARRRRASLSDHHRACSKTEI